MGGHVKMFPDPRKPRWKLGDWQVTDEQVMTIAWLMANPDALAAAYRGDVTQIEP